MQAAHPPSGNSKTASEAQKVEGEVCSVSEDVGLVAGGVWGWCERCERKEER